jgi:glycosyltransferase involved in cell wall biosynthesis
MLLRVFAKLSKDNVDIHCILIGDGSLKAKLEELALQLEVNGRIHFTGKVDNPNRLMSILDLFVSTSFSEGMSNTILEAMACGKPIVATDVGDSGKLVDDGHNGFLVQSEDSIGLEKAIRLILVDKNMLKKCGENSRKIAEQKFDITKMVDRYQDIYFQSIADKRGR